MTAAQYTPEFKLISVCSVWPRSATQVAHIRAISSSHVDWGRVARIAIRHGVSGLVVEGLARAGVAVPDALLAAARRSGLAALRHACETLRLHNCFSEAGIPVLSLKGSSLAQRVYGQIGIRDAVDIDLVVLPVDLERAWRVMDEAGYRMVIPERQLAPAAMCMFVRAAKDSCHRHVENGLVVELHWRLSDDLPDPRLPPASEWQQIELSPAASLSTLRDDALFTYLCTHGAAHLWARLKWLADVGAMVSSSPDGGAHYWRSARSVGAGRAAASAFLLLRDLLGMPLPDGFPVSRSLRVQALNWLALRAIKAGGGERELAKTAYRGWAELTAKLLIAPGAENGLAVLRRLLISAEDIGRLGLPAELSFLYPLLRVPLLIRRRRRRSAQRPVALS